MTKALRKEADYLDIQPVLPPELLDNRKPEQIGSIPVTSIKPDFVPSTEAELLAALGSWEWRMFSGALYRIIIKGEEGQPDTSLPFLPNRAQCRRYDLRRGRDGWL